MFITDHVYMEGQEQYTCEYFSLKKLTLVNTSHWRNCHTSEYISLKKLSH